MIVLDHFGKFKGINGVQHQKLRGSTYPGKRKLLFEIKKRKVKKEKLLKITISGEQEHSVQSADRTKAVQV